PIRPFGPPSPTRGEGSSKGGERLMPLEPDAPPLVDSHAHLDDPRLRRDGDGVLERARRAGVVQVIAIGTTAANSAAVLELARSHRGVYAAVGVHPNDA